MSSRVFEPLNPRIMGEADISGKFVVNIRRSGGMGMRERGGGMGWGVKGEKGR